MLSDKTKREPVRQCAGCCGHFPKETLVRIVNVNGKAVIDREGKAQSRGVYVCANSVCAKKAQKSGRIPRQLGCGADASLFEEIAAASGK